MRVQPRSPGEGYSFVAGYWYPVSGHYKWHDGYWTRPAYSGSHWVAPHHDGQQYYEGYWDGDKGHVNHDHKWDKNNDHNRDYNRDHDHQ
jgi:WXXGXW repeat (2 copies)